MESRRSIPEREDWPGTVRDHKFLELCALAIAGELTDEEQKSLEAHLVECADCRQALKEFGAAADIGVPLLHSHLSCRAPGVEDLPLTPEVKPTESHTMGRLEPDRKEGKTLEWIGLPGLPGRNGRRPMQVNWSYVWMPFAAGVVLTAALGIYSYQFGKQKGHEIVGTAPSIPDMRLQTLEQEVSDLGHDREALKAQLAQRDGIISQLHGQIEKQSEILSAVKDAQASFEHSLQNHESEKQEVAQEQGRLVEKIETAQAALQKAQAELESLRQERSQVQSRADSLEAEIRDLHGQLRDREMELGKQQDLLAHDRDIRDLMGARDLYIAEVYDVAKDGETQKPYGRVFYTKGKSLVFYAYDLDRQTGARNASTFQAWGRRGADKQLALNLGLFYEDSAAKKRWVLKFDNPQTLEQIDGVFVTVEPKGGSQKPSGKALLFASLKIEPNHP